jgi:hypothetical protein
MRRSLANERINGFERRKRLKICVCGNAASTRLRQIVAQSDCKFSSDNYLLGGFDQGTEIRTCANFNRFVAYVFASKIVAWARLRRFWTHSYKTTELNFGHWSCSPDHLCSHLWPAANKAKRIFFSGTTLPIKRLGLTRWRKSQVALRNYMPQTRWCKGLNPLTRLIARFPQAFYLVRSTKYCVHHSEILMSVQALKVRRLIKQRTF